MIAARSIGPRFPGSGKTGSDIACSNPAPEFGAGGARAVNIRATPPAPSDPAAGRVVRSALLITAGMLLFGVVPPSVRLLSDTMSPFQIVFIRGVVGIVLIGGYFVWTGVHRLRTRRPGLHFARATVNFIGMVMWFWALKHVVLAKGVAIHFTMPLFIVLFAVIFLGERLGLRRCAAVLAGFAGALVILRPGVISFGWPEAAIVGSAALYGVAFIFIKVMVREETPLAITFYTSLFMALWCVGPTALDWAPLTADDILPILGLGVCGMIAPVLVTTALRTVDASVVSAFDFLRLPFTALFAFLLFSEVPDTFVWAGAAIIFASAWYVTAQ